jgi:hypothetical protein
MTAKRQGLDAGDLRRHPLLSGGRRQPVNQCIRWVREQEAAGEAFADADAAVRAFVVALSTWRRVHEGHGMNEPTSWLDDPNRNYDGSQRCEPGWRKLTNRHVRDLGRSVAVGGSASALFATILLAFAARDAARWVIGLDPTTAKVTGAVLALFPVLALAEVLLRAVEGRRKVSAVITAVTSYVVLLALVGLADLSHYFNVAYPGDRPRLIFSAALTLIAVAAQIGGLWFVGSRLRAGRST